MLKLTGEYQHIVDDKGRVLVTNKLRSQIDVDIYGSSFFLVLGANGILCLYPERCFEELIHTFDDSITAPNEALDYERMSSALACKVELDAQGRLLINERLKKRAKLKDHITLVGVRDHIELWNEQDWEQYLSDNMVQYQKQMQQARQLMLQKNRDQV